MDNLVYPPPPSTLVVQIRRIIRSSMLPYSSAVLLLYKVEYVAFRKSNKITNSDTAPTPNKKEIVDKMAGNKYVICLTFVHVSAVSNCLISRSSQKL